MTITRSLIDLNLLAFINGSDQEEVVKGENGAIRVSVVEPNPSSTSDTSLLQEVIYAPVTTGDTNVTGTANYAAGSEGSIKTIKVGKVNATTGDVQKVTTFLYANATYPTFATKETESYVTI